jgi:hypothetical protein
MITSRLGLKLFLAFFTITIFSCNSSDNNSNDDTTLQGDWRLVTVTGGIAGTHDEFDQELVQWTFNANGTVTVFNTNTNDNKVDFMDSGDYVYSFMPNPATPQSCTEALVIDGVSFGCQSINGNTMTLSQVENDGYLVTLQKTAFTTFAD